MNPLIILHHCPPQDKPGITPTGQCQLTATSLTLLWQGLQIFKTIGMILGVWERFSCPVPLPVVLPVIVTARNQRWLLRLFAFHIYKKKYIYTFYSLFPLPPPRTLLHHLMPPFPFLAHQYLLLFPFLPQTRNTQEHIMKTQQYFNISKCHMLSSCIAYSPIDFNWVTGSTKETKHY